LGQGDGDLGIATGNTRDNWHPPCHFGQNGGRKFESFGHAQLADLAGHTGVSDSIDTAAQQVSNQVAQTRNIRCTLRIEGCGQHGKDA
jgi:hypothetical protein